MIVPGSIVQIGDCNSGPRVVGLFRPPWEKWKDPVTMPTMWYVVGRVMGGTHLLVISYIKDWEGRTKDHFRDHVYVWVFGKGHIDGSQFGWLPIDHVREFPTT